MAFRNRVRLPFYVTRPQFPTEDNVFRLANGVKKTLSSVVRKVFEAETDRMPKEIHERLIIALKHDDVTVEGRYYLGGVSLEGSYDIDWNKFLDFPLAKAEFKAEVTPFNYSNDNCQTCDEASQLSLEDDTLTGPYEVLEEGQTYEYNVFENDSICCSPVTAEIVTINSVYVASASIDAFSGVVSITMQATIPPATLANLLTYRVTCPNGSYDDADVFGNTDGTEEVCQAPGSLDAGTVTETGASPNWFDLPTPEPESYNYQLYLTSDLLNPIDTGNTTQIDVLYEDLSPGTSYTFFVQSVCEGGGTSEFISVEFTTTGSSGGSSCGQYELYNNDLPGVYATTTYIFCDGTQKNRSVQGSHSTIICALENAPGEPVSIFSNGPVDVTYLGPCV